MTVQETKRLDQIDTPVGDLFRSEFSSNKPLRILLLEDSSSDAELVTYHLGEIDIAYSINHVTNKLDFGDEFTSFRPHLIISDYQLPQFTGKDALVHVRKICSYTPFIMCTGRVNEETAVECIKLGSDDYVLKDDLNRLPSAINQALEAKKTKIQKDQITRDLFKSEENLRAITKNSPSNIYTIDKNGVILFSTNSRKNSPLAKGESIFDYTHPKNHVTIKKHISISFRLKQDVEFEIEGTTRGKEYDWYLCKMGPILQDGEVDRLVFIPHQITDLRKAHLELSNMNVRLNQLNNYLENVRDEEKKKIAMEIHDQLGQELTGSKLGLYWLKQNLQGDLNDKKELFTEKLDDLIDLSTQVISTTRRIAHELRPVVLDDIGLLAALEWHVTNYNKFRSIDCQLEVSCDNSVFDTDISTAIYRIIQESLTNIDKHAKASAVFIRLHRKNNEVQLNIKDNGVGLKIEEALKSKSMGLFGMQERIKHWNGKFELLSEGDGTEIKITLNLPENE